ncbi:hypothetical protein IT882_04310 [Microbacterium schleiferi]|uniref:Uncharacterized protein n=1 Tax=Microbacterium schleiferi TaxID=69362 RepID=A0A7S8MYZ4_9MICO|nr:hypothetical protein [Microbacterium schleiferi]QPE05298.1 hypothetical protein IT882_04310 [Microbacterium schleiferi]
MCTATTPSTGARKPLAEQFTRHFEGTLSDDYGWLAVNGKHYCGEHVEWDDEGDNLVPKTPDQNQQIRTQEEEQ